MCFLDNSPPEKSAAKEGVYYTTCGLILEYLASLPPLEKDSASRVGVGWCCKIPFLWSGVSYNRGTGLSGVHPVSYTCSQISSLTSSNTQRLQSKLIDDRMHSRRDKV